MASPGYPRPKCPVCDSYLRLVPEVSSWYCDTCKRYPQSVTGQPVYWSAETAKKQALNVWMTVVVIVTLFVVVMSLLMLLSL